MKKLASIILVSVILALYAAPLTGQSAATGGEAIELSPGELKLVVRKMAEMRQRRILLLQRQQAAAARRKRVVRSKPTASNNIQAAKTQQDNELADLRLRMARQEEMLQRLLDASTAPAPSPAPAFSAQKDKVTTDTFRRQPTAPLQEPVTDRDAAQLLALTTEVKLMNIELDQLRRQLADEEDRRRRAEQETDRIRYQNNSEQSAERERVSYDRELNRRRAEEENERARARAEERIATDSERYRLEAELRRTRELERARKTQKLKEETAPRTETDEERENAPVRIIRDTVFIDRVTEKPEFIPGDTITDTVTIVKETVREVPADTILRTETVILDREVVKTDTLQLKAREPIGFPTIFFDNNSSKLNTAHRNLLATVVSQLKGKTGYTVRLTGFASPSGNASRNQQLSAQRAAAVEQGLKDAGISGNQIFVVPGGIDFQPVSAAAARRVEIQAIPE